MSRSLSFRSLSMPVQTCFDKNIPNTRIKKNAKTGEGVRPYTRDPNGRLRGRVRIRAKGCSTIIHLRSPDSPGTSKIDAIDANHATAEKEEITPQSRTTEIIEIGTEKTVLNQSQTKETTKEIRSNGRRSFRAGNPAESPAGNIGALGAQSTAIGTRY